MTLTWIELERIKEQLREIEWRNGNINPNTPLGHKLRQIDLGVIQKNIKLKDSIK